VVHVRTLSLLMDTTGIRIPEGSVRTRDKINARRLTRESQRRTRKSDPEKIRKREREYKRKRPQGKKHKVRRKLDWAVESGRMIRPEKCGECGGGGRIEAHHRDYDLPYEVEWLCTGCHGRRHWKENQHHLQETS